MIHWDTRNTKLESIANQRSLSGGDLRGFVRARHIIDKGRNGGELEPGGYSGALASPWIANPVCQLLQGVIFRSAIRAGVSQVAEPAQGGTCDELIERLISAH